jgi:hypothetical protein
MHEMTEFVHALSPDSTVFYNAGHIGPAHRAVADAYTHWELESLPSGFWGYQHFPLTMRYARNLGLDSVSHTGKFHTAWGDFQSFKNPAALQFECFRMIAMNGKCEIGDQLPPNGVLEPAVYELIGRVYASVEEKEPWCRGGKAVSEIGVFTPEAFRARLTAIADPACAAQPASLTKLATNSRSSMISSDLSPFSVLILPDTIPVSPEFGAKLQAYLDNGGKLSPASSPAWRPTAATSPSTRWA